MGYFSLVQSIQENYEPETSVLFYNGQKKTFESGKEQIIDKIVQDYFIEYLSEDLAAYDVKEQEVEDE